MTPCRTREFADTLKRAPSAKRRAFGARTNHTVSRNRQEHNKKPQSGSTGGFVGQQSGTSTEPSVQVLLIRLKTKITAKP